MHYFVILLFLTKRNTLKLQNTLQCYDNETAWHHFMGKWRVNDNNIKVQGETASADIEAAANYPEDLANSSGILINIACFLVLSEICLIMP